eukprot:gene10911-biopygen15370
MCTFQIRLLPRNTGVFFTVWLLRRLRCRIVHFGGTAIDAIPNHASPHQFNRQHQGSRFKPEGERPTAPAIHLKLLYPGGSGARMPTPIGTEKANKATLDTFLAHPRQVRMVQSDKVAKFPAHAEH